MYANGKQLDTTWWFDGKTNARYNFFIYLVCGSMNLPNHDACSELMERPVGECRRAAITIVGTPIIIPRASSSILCASVAST